MEINDKIEYLHRIITGVKSGDTIMFGIFDRFYELGIISIFNDINTLLQELNEQLDVSLPLEAVSIDFDTYLDSNYWKFNQYFLDWDRLYKENGITNIERNYSKDINSMADYFPNGVQGYNFTPAVMESFKKGVHQICDKNKLTRSDLFYALNQSFSEMLSLLRAVKNKTQKPKPHLYTKLYEEVYELWDNDEFDIEYKEWKEDGVSFNELEARQKQEIFKLLQSDFFRFCKLPTGAEVKNCKLKISSDDLVIGTEIPEDLDQKCAIFERFFEWKGGHILALDYKKLGQYIYKNYNRFDEIEFFKITDFDRIMDLIHEDMAQIKSGLSKYLKNYEKNMVIEILNNSSKILNTCIVHLQNGIRKTFLREYLCKLLFDSEIKEEARNALTSQSLKTYMCSIIAALKWHNVFKVNVDSKDLAKSIYKELQVVKEDTLKRYIDNATNERSDSIFNWTSKIIDDLKANEYNIFAGLT